MSYHLKAFGFVDWNDLLASLFLKSNVFFTATVSVSIASVTAVVTDVTGFNLGAFMAFFGLLLAEWYTGIKVATSIKGEKIQSRKLGRMLFKILVYLAIVMILHNLSANIPMPPLFGLEVNPLQWIYYVSIIYIIFQLLVSCLENLGKMGFNEMGKLAFIFKGKLSSWLEIDGDKDNDSFDNEK